jgi:hypothetical protein
MKVIWIMREVLLADPEAVQEMEESDLTLKSTLKRTTILKTEMK